MSLNFFEEFFIALILLNISQERLIFGIGQFCISVEIDIPGAVLLLRNDDMAQVEEVLLGSYQIIFDCGLNCGSALEIFDILLYEQEDLEENRHSIILNEADFEHWLAMTEIHHMSEEHGKPDDADDQDNPVDDSRIELLILGQAFEQEGIIESVENEWIIITEALEGFSLDTGDQPVKDMNAQDNPHVGPDVRHEFPLFLSLEQFILGIYHLSPATILVTALADDSSQHDVEVAEQSRQHNGEDLPESDSGELTLRVLKHLQHVHLHVLFGDGLLKTIGCHGMQEVPSDRTRQADFLLLVFSGQYPFSFLVLHIELERL